MKLKNVIGITGICLALAAGCQTKEERYKQSGIVENYVPANGYDIKFWPAVRGYNLVIGNLSNNGFSDSYILARDFDSNGSIDQFEVSDKNGICYQSGDSSELLDSCKIDQKLRELANTNRLNKLEEGLLHEHR